MSRIEMFPECAENDAVRGPVSDASGNPHAAGLAQRDAAASLPGLAVPETLGAGRGEGECAAPLLDVVGSWVGR